MSDFRKPHPPSTVSHWIATVNNPPEGIENKLTKQNRGPGSLHNYGKDDALPENADIVIVGGQHLSPLFGMRSNEQLE
jgi:hypothetical protein